VQSCPSKALVFGDLNDPESEVSRLFESPRGGKLLEDLGTIPKVQYLG
jgi:molybdopterin-containing oxidoreductase family iron-sulfur binding subunit